MWEMTLCLCQYCSWYTFSLAMEIFSLILVKVLHISDIFLVKNGIPVFHVHLQFSQCYEGGGGRFGNFLVFYKNKNVTLLTLGLFNHVLLLGGNPFLFVTFSICLSACSSPHPSITHHISGTTHHVIIIFVIHV